MKGFATKSISMLTLLSAPCIAMADGDGGVDIAKNMSVLFEIAYYIAGAVGFILFASGLYKIYDNSKGRSDARIGVAILEMLVGTFMVSIGWVYEVFKASFLTGSKNGVDMSQGQMALALDSAAASASSAVGSIKGFTDIIPAHTVEGVLAFIFLVGFINLISGVYALKDVSSNRAESPIKGPVTKIIAGAICMNILWFGCLINALLGIPGICVE
ncbi:hypothetical protein ACSQ5K_26485 [Pseudomonas sp. PhalM4]